MESKRRVISLLVDNQSGVLARVSNLFCRRGFNIDSLTVSATNDPTVSRITADEAGVFLGRTPDVLTLNGLDLRVIPDYSRDRSLAAASRQRLLEAAGRLLRRRLPEDTRIFLVSGRYEYHNKGIDVFLDALGMVNTALSQSQSNVLALCAVMGGHSGVNADAVSGDPAKLPGQGGFWISSHHVYNQPNDPILNACQRLGLDNRPENHVQVIFDPALLDGKDGFLNMRYEEVLAACDLGVFPSWYEPWGYTPQESAAHAVPTVTTDLSGFGMWVRSSQRDKNGVSIICRRQTSYDETAASLRDVLLQYASLPEEQMQEHRHMVRHVAEGCSWEQFFPYYVQAYGLALDKARQRSSQPAGGSTTLTRVLAATMSTADSQMLAAASSVSQNILQEFGHMKLTEKQSLFAARLTIICISVVGVVLARDPNSSVFGIVSFAWAGFGGSFGAVVLCSLFWKRCNWQGALAGMLSGGLMVFVWKYIISPLGGVFGIYELLPAFLMSLVVCVVVSLVTPAPSAEIEAEFDAAK